MQKISETARGTRRIGGSVYTKAQWRRLNRHICFLCEHRLTSEECHSIFLPHNERCTQALMERKRSECLAGGRTNATRL
jgi:hypothetical protein